MTVDEQLDRRTLLGRWLACALGGLLIAYLCAVLTVEPVAHDASLPAWRWFWDSYGAFMGGGLLLGGLAGLLLGAIRRRVHSVGARPERKGAAR